jgi:hypothetical protein
VASGVWVDLIMNASAMPSAVTANVWGQGRAAQQLATQAASLVKDAEEECMICRDDVPATIAFVPCAHRVCFACVENMRAKNIFRVRLVHTPRAAAGLGSWGLADPHCACRRTRV